MNNYIFISALLLAVAILVSGCVTDTKEPGETGPGVSEQNEMSFFITGTGSGNGADLGGLTGADSHCQDLAEAAGSTKTWRAYLSATGVNARDRIGTGPWYNTNGVLIATNLDNLHSDNNITKETALTEKGDTVNGRGDTPNRHDILTGSQMDGTAFNTVNDTTCQDWTSSMNGSAFVGHHDRLGLRDDEPSRSWVSSHASRGCSQSDLQSTGGDGLFYCFAID